MASKNIFHTNFRLLACTLGGLLILLIILEGWRYAVKPSVQQKDEVITEKLEESARMFTEQQQNLLRQSQNLAQSLQSKMEKAFRRSELLKEMQSYPNMWGIGLYQGLEPVVWTGYSLEVLQEITKTTRSSSSVEVRKQNNVIFWICHVKFSIRTPKGNVPYHLYTSRRIQQRNALPIADELEFDVFNQLKPDGSAFLQFSIYSPPPPDDIPSSVLKTTSGDSVGVVYAAANHFERSLKQWNTANQFWRTLFALLCFVIISLLIYFRVDRLPLWSALGIQLFIIAIGWLVFEYIAIARQWIPVVLDGVQPTTVRAYQALFDFSIDALFFSFAGLTLSRKIKNHIFSFKSAWVFNTILSGFIAGLINLGGIVVVFQQCYLLAQSTSIPLLTLKIYPGIGVLLFYLAVGLMLWGLSILLMAVNHFLLRSSQNQYKLFTAICVFSFTISLLLAQLFAAEVLQFQWPFIICLGYFGLIFLLSYILFRSPSKLERSSPLRSAAVASLVLSLTASIIIYQAQLNRIDTRLQVAAQEITQTGESSAQALTRRVLTDLERNFRSITEEDLQQRISFMQERFSETVESMLNQSQQPYSVDLLLIKSNQQLVANYSTDLNSPDWVNFFDFNNLKAAIQIERITKSNIRPVIQQPELLNSHRYNIFYRGWIPLFGQNENEPIAWILGSVYQDRPNINMPIRAVLASFNYSKSSESYAIHKYRNNRLSETIFQGFGTDYPRYNMLQTAEVQALEQDSTVFYTGTISQQTYRNLLVRESERSTIKAITILPGYQNILFAFFRLSFTLLIAGFLLLMIYKWVKTGRLQFFGANKQFKYRILDSFLLATLLFLIILVISTHFAIGQQNKKLVQQELFETLESITDNPNTATAFRTNPQGAASSVLDSLIAPYNIDAALYDAEGVTQSTTPQIYQQHLLPGALPFPVYDALFRTQKRNALSTVRLDKQDLLIGYRSILSEDGTPVAVMAMPTFVQSPKYNRQLLETTSYLIILYLVIFGLFVVGTTFIAHQLTRSLPLIRQGLNKISEGDLSTTIPDTGKDEIGSLATAYNEMVGRLQQLQDELATAEREAAWKEMAQQVAHEIKNPLTPMKLNIQHLERQISSENYDAEQLKEKITSITKNLVVQIQSLSNIASDFSTFAKPIEDDFSAVDIHPLIKSVCELYEHDDAITTTIETKAEKSVVWGAKDELRRMFINLIKNAREAMPHGGTIAISTYVRQKNIFIEIDDTGTGMSEEDKSNIFVPNFSTKSSGTGLGLAISKKVLEAHEGSISFASIKGEGTTFVVKIPLVKR